MKKCSLVTAAASVVLVLGTAAPAVAGGDTGRGGLEISPSSGRTGDTVLIKADKSKCPEGGKGTAASQAFAESHVLGFENNDNLDSDHHGRDHRGGDHHGRDHRGGDHRGKEHHGKGKPVFKPFAKATVGNDELEPGTYEVVAFCRDGSLLRGEFEFLGVGGAANAGLGGLASGSDSGTSTTATAATAAGGAAVAGLAGYLLIMRRRANADQA